ncbi:MAG: hypothetical protein R2860_15605 [Desulfobacterales bacterium]
MHPEISVRWKNLDAHPHVKAHHQYCPTCAKLLSDRIQACRP